MHSQGVDELRLHFDLLTLKKSIAKDKQGTQSSHTHRKKKVEWQLSGAGVGEWGPCLMGREFVLQNEKALWMDGGDGSTTT